MRRKWPLSCKQLVGYTSQRILIALLGDRVLELLGSHIRRRPNNCREFNARRLYHRRHTKIRQQGLALRIEKNIFRLDIPVNDVLLVCIIESLPDLRKNRQRLLHRQRMRSIALDAVTQGTIERILRHQVRESLMYAHIEYRENIRMFEYLQELRLLQKALTLL